MDLDTLLQQYAWNLAYADALTRDVPEALWARSGGPGLENHPAWTLGHLITGSALVAADLGAAITLPDGWRERFERRGPNDARKPDEAPYPSRAELWPVFAGLHDRVGRALRAAPADWFATREAWRFDGFLPTNAAAAVFMLVAHETVHLGQLGCWRRRFDLPSAMAAMGRGPA